MVVISHGTGAIRLWLLFPLWIDQAVPVFLLIQVFHAYKSGSVRQFNTKKVWNRILQPFLCLQVIFIVYYVVRSLLGKDLLCDRLIDGLRSGGWGAGSYYIWIYVQFALLLPCLHKCVKIRYACALFVVVSVLVEIVCSVSHIPEYLYRLLCLRYLFLIYLGYGWVKDGGVLLTRKRLVLACLSILSILTLQLLHTATSVTLEPLVFDTNWTIFHWFTYFLPWSLLPVVLYQLYRWVGQTRIGCLLTTFGHASFQIFLLQMLVYQILPFPGVVNMAVCFVSAYLYINRCKLLQG